MTYVEKIKRLRVEVRAQGVMSPRQIGELDTLAARFVELYEAVADEHSGCVDECDTCATLARIDGD